MTELLVAILIIGAMGTLVYCGIDAIKD